MSVMGRRVRITTAALIAVCLVGLAGGAWAVNSQLTAGDLVKGCVKIKGGTLRLAAKCQKGERAVSWHRNGPAGAQGLRGATGAAGAQGAQGTPGGPGAVGSFDTLAELPCQVGTPKVGKVTIARNPNTGVQSILCVPDDGSPLQSTATLQPGMVDPSLADPTLFAWVTPTLHNNLNVVAEFHRFLEPTEARTQNFNDNLVYEIHIARGASSLADLVTYRFRFTTPPATQVDPADLNQPPGGGKEPLEGLTGRKQTYTLTKISGGTSSTVAAGAKVAPPNLGPRAFFFQKGLSSEVTYTDPFAAEFLASLTGGGRVWAGPRDEAAYADLGALHDSVNLRAQGTAKDSYAGYNSLDVALEIPAGQLTSTGSPVTTNVPDDANTLGIWMSVSVPLTDVSGNTVNVQLARSGMPMFNKLLIGEQDKALYASSTPASDAANLGADILNPVLVRDAEAFNFYGGPAPAPFKSNRADILDVFNIKDFPSPNAHHIATVGDVLRLDLGVDTAFPNGLAIPSATADRLGTDYTDVLVSYILTETLATVHDGVIHNDANYLAAMPWAALPWTYSNTSHGVTTP